jgi:hypothetical protein
MGRKYSIAFEEVTVAAAQDLFEVVAPSNKVLIVHEVKIANVSSETSEQWSILVHRASTSGSSGTTPTARPLDPGDAAAGFTPECNNTTQGTEGTFVHADGFNILNGWHWLPIPEDRPVVPGGGRLVVELQTTPTSTTCSGTMIVEEIG